MLNKSILVTINNLLPPLNKMPFWGLLVKDCKYFEARLMFFTITNIYTMY
jgi:hypothetical protein